MDSMLTKAGSFLFAKRAKKEMDSFGDDLNVSLVFLLRSCNLLIFHLSSFKCAHRGYPGLSVELVHCTKFDMADSSFLDQMRLDSLSVVFFQAQIL